MRVLNHTTHKDSSTIIYNMEADDGDRVQVFINAPQGWREAIAGVSGALPPANDIDRAIKRYYARRRALFTLAGTAALIGLVGLIGVVSALS